MCKICRLFLTFSKLMTFLIISYFAPHVTLFNMVQTSVHAYCDGHSPFCNYFFNCTSWAIIDIWITFLKSFTVYWRNIFAWMSYVIKKVLGNVEIKIKKGVKQCCRNFLRHTGFIGTAEDINMNSWTSTDVTDFTRDVTKIIIYRYDSPCRFM